MAKDSDFTQTHLTQHVIDTTPNWQPRQLLLAQRWEAEVKTSEMVAAGLIIPSVPGPSQAVLMGQQDSSLRFCVDYRFLNLVTREYDNSVRTIPVQLPGSPQWRLAGSSKCKSACPMTAFTIGKGLCELNIMPLGLTNFPVSFNLLME